MFFRKLVNASIFALTVSLFFFFAPNDPVENIARALDKYREEYPQEKIFVHHDKPYYVAGDVIWLKAYLVAGTLHQPSPLSQTINIELVNSKKEIVNVVKLKSEKGFTHGSLPLADSLVTGRYLLRAYTPWMTNFDQDFFFQEEIQISGLEKMKVSPTDGVIDLQFFPESGNLLTGLRNKVAFKAIGPDGLGRQIKLNVSDETGALAASASANLFGMGFFFFIPQPGKTYKAVIEGSNKEYVLPSPTEKGFLLAVTNKPDQPVVARVQCTESTQDKSSVLLVAQCRGVLTFMAKLDLSRNLFIAKIPNEKLLTGINHITLFDSRGLPVAERLIFVDRNDGLKISAQPTKTFYKPRERTDLEVKVVDKDGKGVSGNFSLAVVDSEQIFAGSDRLNIVSCFLLTSDLKGNIERPGYYFDESNDDRVEALDVLLLTQGWRRFDWKKIIGDQWPAIHAPIDNGISISGKLLDIANSKPAGGGKVIYMETATSEIQVQNLADDGLFRFDGLIFYDSASVVLQGENKRGNKAVKFSIDPEKKTPVEYSFQRPLPDMDKQEEEYVRRSYDRRKYNGFAPDGKAIELKTVEVSATRIEKPLIDRIFGKGSKTLKMADDPSSVYAFHPLQLIQGKVAGVQVQGSGYDYSVVIRGTGSINSGNSPLIMVDNMPLDVAALGSYRAQDFESVEVFKGADAAVFGSQGANGAILFYTKKGSSSSSPRMGIINLNYGGYAVAREFYSPGYDVSQPEHGLADLRSTIFWAPVVQTDSTGVARVSFYNADAETTLTGFVQGISGYGKPAAAQFTYEVRK